MSKNNLLKVSSNTKLGRGVAAFSLPAVSTCPGRTKLCESICYATDGFFNMPNVKNSLLKSYQESKTDDFADRVVAELSRKRTLVAVRIHPSGDFYDIEYVQKWISIARRMPNIKFWAYTRSWRIPEMLPWLKILSSLDNVQLWASVDDEIRPNIDSIPSWLRLADVQDKWDDADSTYVKCPNQKNKKITCATCSYCFKPAGKRKTNVIFKVH